MKLKNFTPEQKENRKRILEISYEEKLSHLGSCLTAIDLIDGVYKVKEKDEKFVLSNGHAGIALYTILEKHGLIKDKETPGKLHIHPDRNQDLGIDVSTGSLGQGLPIAVGLSLANPKKRVYCMISDGESSEGSIWEALRIARDNGIANLTVIVNWNGWGAYSRVEKNPLLKQFEGFGYRVTVIDGHDVKAISSALSKKPNGKPHVIFAQTIVEQFEFLKGQSAHYYVMREIDYLKARIALIEDGN